MRLKIGRKNSADVSLDEMMHCYVRTPLAFVELKYSPSP